MIRKDFTFTELLFFLPSYLLNPFTILSCVAKSTCVLNNCVIALFILTTVKGNVSLPLYAVRSSLVSSVMIRRRVESNEPLTKVSHCCNCYCYYSVLFLRLLVLHFTAASITASNQQLKGFFLCVAGNVLLSAIFLSLATYQSIYVFTLCAPALLYLMQVRHQVSQ